MNKIQEIKSRAESVMGTELEVSCYVGKIELKFKPKNEAFNMIVYNYIAHVSEDLAFLMKEVEKLERSGLERNKKLESELVASQRIAQDARNELCLKCGRYRESHNGACNGCKWE